MPATKIRFVTACQQILALGVVLAVLTPAASVISLDVVHERTPSAAAQASAAGLAAYTRETQRSSTVPAEVVDPTVAEYGLTAAAGATARARSAVAAHVQQASRVAAKGTKAQGTKAGLLATAQESLTSVAEPVVGYGAVGVTWAHGVQLEEDEITLQVRTRTGSAWTGWTDLEYHDDHGPDPDSKEGRHARPGTDALLVGDVDDVQVRVETDGTGLPADLRLAVIDPGEATSTEVERPALDTDAGTAAATTTEAETVTSVATDAGEGTDGSDAIDLQAATYTPRPQIYSRAQWGADEKLRDASSLRYYEVHAGFVHHTVNANDYSRDEVPGIIRSIYAYHTKSRGWSDIGYNFLVDRFGRIWEGRYGGIDRPVVGAHTLNYNDYSFAMSAIGNYDVKKPSSAMVQAYGALFAWKLSLHGIDASSTRQTVGSRTFQAINGHRDAASTACPGRYLYARIPDIRRLAAEAQRGWAGRELESNIASTAHPDLIVRRASDQRVFLLPTGGLTSFATPVAAASRVTTTDRVVVSPDLTGDGRADLVTQAAGATGVLRAGTTTGTFGTSTSATLPRLRGRVLLAGVGDLNADGRNDLVTRTVSTGRIDILLRRSNGAYAVRRTSVNGSAYNLVTGAGDSNGDGKADLLARDGSGRLWLLPGTGSARLGTPVALPGSWSGYSTIDGTGDFTGDGRRDLFVRSARSGLAAVLPARANGVFGRGLGPVRTFVGKGAVVGVTQVLGDGTPDVVTRSGSGLTVAANGGGTETRSLIDTGLVLPRTNLLLNAGDWDRDGRGDLITRSPGGVLQLRRGDGAGHFGPAVTIGTGFASVKLLAAVGDMTGDGWPDLMGQPSGGAIRIYPGAGVSGLRTSYVAHGAIKASAQVAVGRWDADGAPDSLFRSGSKTVLYPGNGPGGLTSGRSVGLDLSPYDWVIGISDIGLTGHADLVVRRKATGALYLIAGSATGFAKPRFLAEGMGGYDLAG